MTGLTSLTRRHPLLDLLLRAAAIVVVSVVILLFLPALASAAG